MLRGVPKGSDRWPRRDLRHRFPLARERQHGPRFDGIYRSVSDDVALRFDNDGTVTWDEESGVWNVNDGELLITTDARQCSGAIDPECIFLLCAAPEAGRAGRTQHELCFCPAP